MATTGNGRSHSALNAALDIFRMRQYFSVVTAAAQVRTCQQAQLTREHLARLRRVTRTLLIEPVPYHKVAGTGFYEQFLDTREGPEFMRAGREAMLSSLRQRALREAA